MNLITHYSYFSIEIQTPPILLLNADETLYKVRENEDVTFTVKFSGTPEPDAEWYTSQKVVPKTKRTKKTKDEGSASLTIQKVVDEDAGEYTIKLQNPAGEVEANLTLILLSKKKFKQNINYHLFSYLKFIYDLTVNLNNSNRTTFGTW